MGHTPGMPAAMMPGGPLPPDVRRVSVQLVLTAGPGGLQYRGADFRLGRRGEAGQAPERDGVGVGRLPSEYRMDGELVFRVPVSARSLVLTELRSGRAVEVAVPAGGTRSHDGHASAAPAPSAGAASHSAEHRSATGEAVPEMHVHSSDVQVRPHP